MSIWLNANKQKVNISGKSTCLKENKYACKIFLTKYKKTNSETLIHLYVDTSGFSAHKSHKRIFESHEPEQKCLSFELKHQIQP